MKVVILAGGQGTRMAEETEFRPKPMVEVCGKPIIWHIMKIYSSHGFEDFLVASGYKGGMIKEYFAHFNIHNCDFIVDQRDGSRHVIGDSNISWRTGIFDTGVDTMTGGRLLRMRNMIGGNTFMATYGDGIGNIDIQALVAFHRSHGKLATVTAVHPPARFGAITLDGNRVRKFSEKSPNSEGWINGGFFVFEPNVFDLLVDDSTVLEREPLETLAREGNLMAFHHDGFWQPMDTLRDRRRLEELWSSGDPPWKTWK